MNAVALLPTPEQTPIRDHAATLQRLAELASTRHQQLAAQTAETPKPPRLVFLRAALRCAKWLERDARYLEAAACVAQLAPVVPVLDAVASAAEAADALDEASGKLSGQPLTLWTACVMQQAAVDDLLNAARAQVAEPPPPQRARAPRPLKDSDLAEVVARAKAAIAAAKEAFGDEADDDDWDDLLADDDDDFADDS